MNNKLRQSLIGFIWPGPIAGPVPINLFRVVSPVLVFYTSPIFASLVMGIISSVLSIVYFSLLELTGGKEYVESLLKKMPDKTHKGIESKGPVALFVTSIFLGVFPYAIFLRLLKYPRFTSKILLLFASFLNSLLWTGVFWGTLVEIFKNLPFFAF